MYFQLRRFFRVFALIDVTSFGLVFTSGYRRAFRHLGSRSLCVRGYNRVFDAD